MVYCTSITVAEQSPDISNLGWGEVSIYDGRFSTCSLSADMIGKDMVVWFDYNGLFALLSGTITYKEAGTLKSFNFSSIPVIFGAPVGIVVLDQKYKSGTSYTELAVILS